MCLKKNPQECATVETTRRSVSITNGLPVARVTQKERALSWVALKVLEVDFPNGNAENKKSKNRKKA